MISHVLGCLTAASVGLLGGILLKGRREQRGQVLEERNAHELTDAGPAHGEALELEEQHSDGGAVPAAGNTGFVGPAGNTGFVGPRAWMPGDPIQRSTEIHWVPDEPPLPPLPPGHPALKRAATDELGGPGFREASEDDPTGGGDVLWSGRPPAIEE